MIGRFVNKSLFSEQRILYLTKQVWIWQYFQSMLYRHNLFPSTCVIKGLVKGRSYTCVGKTLALERTLEESWYQTDLCLPSVFSNWTRLPPLLLWKHCFFFNNSKDSNKSLSSFRKKNSKKNVLLSGIYLATNEYSIEALTIFY